MGVERIKDVIPFRIRKFGRDGFSTKIQYIDICSIDSSNKEVLVEFLNDRIQNPVTLQGNPESLAQNFEIVVDQLREIALAVRDSNQPAAVQDPDSKV